MSGIKADTLHESGDSFTQFTPLRLTVDDEWFGDDVANGHPWIERSIGILEDILDVFPIVDQTLVRDGEEIDFFLAVVIQDRSV